MQNPPGNQGHWEGVPASQNVQQNPELGGVEVARRLGEQWGIEPTPTPSETQGNFPQNCLDGSVPGMTMSREEILRMGKISE